MENNTEKPDVLDIQVELENLVKAVRTVVSAHLPWYKESCRCSLCALKESLDSYAVKTI